ncbi:hypothetical protein HDU81_003933 [Chytriomyces hyalinus]|nr:hypothetical protein HDU81_003933 [Chytriomyces hyalinus]
MHALVTGPSLSSYSLGLFDFVFAFPPNYPTDPPKVKAITTGSSDRPTRFNPNIYANGKVCLSILGTWRGESGEQWSAAHGVLSILISIQSLMSDRPYLNEPGFENTTDGSVIADYSNKIMHETIRITICDRLEKYLDITPANDKPASSRKSAPKNDSDQSSKVASPNAKPPAASAVPVTSTTGSMSDPIPVSSIKGDAGSTSTDSLASLPLTLGFCSCSEKSPFEDTCKRLFLVYFDVYKNNIQKEVAKGIKDGAPFRRTRFESAGNSMEGQFDYSSLKARLDRIYEVLKGETESWISHSLQWIKDDTLASSNIRNQFEQIRASGDYSRNVMLNLLDDNPFIWTVTFTDLSGTLYEDGIFPCRLVFHNQFPDVLPRAQFLVDFFHPNVTTDGIPFYSVKRPEDVRQHLAALLKLFTEKPDPQPATHVGIRAAEMFLKGESGTKDYNRNCRRCVQRSLEC